MTHITIQCHFRGIALQKGGRYVMKSFIIIDKPALNSKSSPNQNSKRSQKVKFKYLSGLKILDYKDCIPQSINHIILKCRRCLWALRVRCGPPLLELRDRFDPAWPVLCWAVSVEYEADPDSRGKIFLTEDPSVFPRQPSPQIITTQRHRSNQNIELKNVLSFTRYIYN